MKVTFQEVRRTGEKAVRCTDCGKVLRRRRKFWQTLSPFNRLPNGRIKGAQDILQELDKDIAAWKTAPETCAKCADQGGEDRE